LIKWAVLLLSLWLPVIAAAETATFEINYLPLQEAEAIIKSQLEFIPLAYVMFNYIVNPSILVGSRGGLCQLIPLNGEENSANGLI